MLDDDDDARLTSSDQQCIDWCATRNMVGPSAALPHDVARAYDASSADDAREG
jgi:hypothetical protein